MAVVPYATRTELEHIWSEFGVDVRLDDDDDGVAQSGLVAAVLEEATVKVNYHLLARYSVATLAASAWVKWAAANIAACLLARRRGNPIPEAMQADCDEYLDALKEIKAGSTDLPADAGLASPEFDSMPSVSNLTVDGRYRRRKVRRVASTSTGSPPVGGPQQFNTRDLWEY